MFLEITDKNILDIRNEKFPTSDAVSIRNVIVKNSGTDNIIDFSLDVLDYYAEPQTSTTKKTKIFKNQYAKNNLKIKVFEINSQFMKNDLLNLTTIEEIEYVIKTYGALSVEFFAGVDFIGDKKDPKAHNLQKDNITLTYRNKFILSRKEIGFFSIGIIFYNDYKTYVKESQIPEKYINKKTLNSNLKIIDIFDTTGNLDLANDSTSVNVNPDIVQDLRTVNKIFKQNDILEKIYEQINFDSKITKILSKNEKNIDNTPFFSKPVYSRDTKGNLNILFNFDYRKIIENYSSFSKVIKNSSFPDDIYDKCKVSSFKVVRRQYDWDKNINKKPILRRTPAASLIETTQDKYLNATSLFTKQNNEAFIKEIDIFPAFRTVEFVDKSIYKTKRSFYQYGVEIKIDDGYPEYLKVLRDSLLEQIRVFKEYLGETNNIVKPQNSIKPQKQTTIGYYDSVTDSFTRRFAQEIFPRLYQDRITYSISNFVSVLKVLGVVADKKEDNQLKFDKISFVKKLKTTRVSTKKVDQDELVSSLIALVSPTTADINTITYFIKTYEKVINQLNHLLKSNISTSFDIEYWFDGDYIDASENPKVGYGFFDVDKTFDGFLRVDNVLLEEKVAYDTFNFILDNVIEEKKQNVKYSYLSPAFVSTRNKKLNLNSIDNFEGVDFIDMELNIKRNNLLGDEEKDFFLDDDVRALPQQEQNIKLKTSQHMTKFSSFFKNQYLPLSDFKNFKSEASISNLKQNTQVNPNLLFLGMLKNTTGKTTFNKVNNITLNNKIGVHKTKYLDIIPEDAPYQISSLIQKRDKLFSPSSIKYFTDLNNNSKFLLLYNTIHKVEILVKGQNIKDDIWVPLTTQIYNDLPSTAKRLCRLNLYQSAFLGINFFQEISLPIFDKYFILQKTFTEEQVKTSIENLQKKFSFSLPAIKENLVINTFPKTFLTIGQQRETQAPTALVPQEEIPQNTIISEKSSFKQKEKYDIDVPILLSNLASNANPLNVRAGGLLGAIIQPPVLEKNNSSKAPSEELQQSLVSILSTPIKILSSEEVATKNQSIIKDQQKLLNEIIAPVPVVSVVNTPTINQISTGVIVNTPNSNLTIIPETISKPSETTVISKPNTVFGVSTPSYNVNNAISTPTVAAVPVTTAYVPVEKPVIVAQATYSPTTAQTTPNVTEETNKPMQQAPTSRSVANTSVVNAASQIAPITVTVASTTPTEENQQRTPQEIMKSTQNISKATNNIGIVR